MRCESVRKKLDRLRRQELATRTRERMEAHLHECAECRQQLARQERLVGLLKSVPEPPAVPTGFEHRLMAAVRERQAISRPVPASIERRRWLCTPASLGRQTAQALVCVAGLLIGIFMAQQTWDAVHPVNSQSARQVDSEAMKELDYLVDVRGDSLAESYLLLTRSSSQNGT
ncbi:MAG: anti-sigma factor family protein [Pirellulaceae bacterium]